MGEPAIMPVYKKDDRFLPVAEEPINTQAGVRPLAWLVGCHGGAGVSTLEAVFAPLTSTGQVIPAANDPATVILVAEVSKRGLRAAHKAVLQFETDDAGGAHLAGVMLVHRTPGKTPKALTGDLERLTEATPGGNVWNVPFFSEWVTTTADGLPEWEPGYEPPARKKLSRKPGVLDVVPEAVMEIGDDMAARCVTVNRRAEK